MTASLTVREARRRFLVLRGLRWLPTGITMPVLVLLLLDRGLGLAQVGVALSAQMVAVMALELPTGGLADALGRRRVLLLAGGFQIAALTLLTVAGDVWLLAATFALEGVYRALESGPLDAWYVDAAQAADPDADIEGALATGGVVLGLAITTGTLVSSGLVAWDPVAAVDPLVLPVLAALVLRIVELAAIHRLVVEVRPSTTDAPAGAGRVRSAVRRTRAEALAVPSIVRDALGMVRRSRALVALVGIELLWGLGMIAFEVHTPARLEVVLDEPAAAAALMGPASAAGWGASAIAAGMAPRLTRLLGATGAGTALLAVQAAAVVGIGLASGPLGIVSAFVGTMAAHGAANPVHQGLLHRAVTDPGRRATVLSANSLMASVGGGIGAIGLGALADATTISTAVLVGAAALAVAAPGYQLVRRAAAGQEPPAPPLRQAGGEITSR
ncbi:MFS transporter [Euzebya sp.]|uniref:MFS transporter n=1 Tax=Euzebya sp. TaxID=1971409 RepID=UPI0035122A55